MRVLFKEQLLVLIPESEQERGELESWKTGHPSHVFANQHNAGAGLSLGDLGPREHACREPFQVISTSPDPVSRLISNLAETPFVLDGQEYRSVEGFWQGLKFYGKAERQRVAALAGLEARAAGRQREYGRSVTYQGREAVVGTWEHWQLMELACQAKFTQHEEARAALLSTGERPLQHKVRRDSRTIPGVIMADIWMRLRRQLRNQPDEPAAEEG